MDGATTLEAQALSATEVDIDASGASKAEVHVSRSLHAEASGGAATRIPAVASTERAKPGVVASPGATRIASSGAQGAHEAAHGAIEHRDFVHHHGAP